MKLIELHSLTDAKWNIQWPCRAFNKITVVTKTFWVPVLMCCFVSWEWPISIPYGVWILNSINLRSCFHSVCYLSITVPQESNLQRSWAQLQRELGYILPETINRSEVFTLMHQMSLLFNSWFLQINLNWCMYI